MQRAFSGSVGSLPWHNRHQISVSLLLGLIVVTSAHADSTFSSSTLDNNYATTYLRGDIRKLEECNEECCLQYQSDCVEKSENEWVQALPFAVQIILIVILIMLSALFSGLTLGLMGLDKTGLEIVMEGDDSVNAEAAKIIYPVRKDGNLLLCTLLLGNVAVNALLSILLADMSSGAVGFFVSTILIVIFGEIVPQAFCSRFALIIGSKAVPIVRVIILILYVFAKPLALCLDKILGSELATTYSSAEMLKLLQIHVQEKVLDQETAVAMEGALKYKDKAVKDVMTPLEHTFMLSVDEKLNFEMIARIFKTGYSRIPVYDVSQNNVTGLLFTKDLIFIDPDDETPIRSFVEIFGRSLHTVWPDDKLGGVLRDLKQGRTHMALVRDVNNEVEDQDPFYEIKGIITLEDIIEEILGLEIVDETDAFVDVTETVKVDRAETFEWARLRLLDSKIVDERLSYDEAKAVTANFRTNFSDVVGVLTDNQLHRMVSETSVTNRPTAVREIGKEVPEDLLYKKGEQVDYCTLILSGKVTVLAGNDNFRSDVSSWAVLGASALRDSSFKPDFTAYVSGGPLRCLHFTRDRFIKAVDASTIERRTNTAVSNSDVAQSGVEKPGIDASVHSEPIRSIVDIGRGKDSKFMAALHVGKHRHSPLKKNLKGSRSTGNSVSVESFTSQNDCELEL